jgi:predicted MFS family arabinose efflux permease
MMLFGAGFGVTQNASLALLFQRVSTSGYGMVSALWNLAYDAGLGVGAAGFGVLAAQTGYPTAFALTAALVLVAIAPTWRDRTAG